MKLDVTANTFYRKFHLEPCDTAMVDYKGFRAVGYTEASQDAFLEGLSDESWVDGTLDGWQGTAEFSILVKSSDGNRCLRFQVVVETEYKKAEDYFVDTGINDGFKNSLDDILRMFSILGRNPFVYVREKSSITHNLGRITREKLVETVRGRKCNAQEIGWVQRKITKYYGQIA